MSDKIKVTDKRMFTPDGELREGPEKDVREDDSGGTASAGREWASERAESERPRPRSEDLEPEFEAAPPEPSEDRFASGFEPDQETLPEPTFVDLVSLLAQPIPVFLGDAKMPGAGAEENLPLARFHIDLLELVQSKTRGNISAQEAKMLEDLLYQLRMRYLEKAR